MTIHAGAGGTSERGPDTFDHGSGPNSHDESQFNEKLAELGLEPITAYARVARAKKKVSEAATKKREYRAQRKAEGFGQYVVEIPEDEEAKNTVYAVAKTIEADKDNAKSVRSTILSFVSRAALLELVKLLSASEEADISSIIELIGRGDLARVAAIHAARPSLLDDVSRLLKSNDCLSALDCLIRHAGDISQGSARGLLDAAAAATGCPEVLRLLEVRQRGGLRARLLGWVLGGASR